MGGDTVGSRPEATVHLLRRPIGALVAGYGIASAVLAAGVGWQAGTTPALVALAGNFLIFSPGVGLVWLAGRIIEPRVASETWWVKRGSGYLLGFFGIVALALVPALAMGGLELELRALYPVFLGVTVGANALALTAALGLEGRARRG